MGQLPEWYDAVGPGWRSILVKLHEELTEVHSQYNVDQTKEKFGTLRVYLSPMPASIFDTATELVHNAERASEHICEACGQPGTTRQTQTRWWLTLCDPCLDRTNKTPRTMY